LSLFSHIVVILVMQQLTRSRAVARKDALPLIQLGLQLQYWPLNHSMSMTSY